MKHTLIFALLALCLNLTAHAEPAPVEAQLSTRWTAGVSATDPWPEYPRPQLVRVDPAATVTDHESARPEWTNLNGLWQYAIRKAEQSQPDSWDGEIVVPFCIESALSRVKKNSRPQRCALVPTHLHAHG